MFYKHLSPILTFCLIMLFIAPAYAQTLLADRAVITPENVAQLQPLGRYGTGELSDAFAWSPDETTLAIGGATGIWLYASDALTTPFDFIPTDRYVDRLGFSPDGRYLAYRTHDVVVHLLDYATRTEIQTFENAQAFAFHPEMPLFTVGLDQTIYSDLMGDQGVSSVMLWDIPHQRVLKTFEVRTDQWAANNIVNLDFSTDGSLLAMAWQSGEYSTCGDRASVAMWWHFDDLLNHTEAELNDFKRQFEKYLPEHYHFGVKFHPSKNVIASARVGMLTPYPVTTLLDIYDPLTEEMTTYDFDPQSYKSIVTFDFDANGDQIHALVGNSPSWGYEIFTLDLSDGTVVQDTRFSGWIRNYAPVPYPTAVTSGQYHIARDSGDLINIGAPKVWPQNTINDAGSAFLTREIDGTWQLWALDESESMAAVPLPADYQDWIPQFVPGGQIIKLDATENERRFALWDFDAGTSFEIDASTLRDDWNIVDFSANGERMAVQRTDGAIEIYDTSTGTQLSTLDAEFDSRVMVAFRPEGTHLTTAHFVNTGDLNTSTIEVREWVSDTGALHRDFSGHVNNTEEGGQKTGSLNLQYSTDGTRLGLQASYTHEAEQKRDYFGVHVFDVTSGEALFTHQEENRYFQRGVFTDDLHYHALNLGDWSDVYVVLTDLWQSSAISEAETSIDPPYGVVPSVFSRNNTRLLLATGSVTGCGGSNRALLLHDVQTLALVSTIRLPFTVISQGGREDYSFSPDSRLLLISTNAGTEIYDAEAGELITEIDGLDNSRLHFSADGTLLIAARDDGTVTLWGIPDTER